LKQEFELLYFRHSIAEDYHEHGDRFRRLTAEGRAEVERSARQLVRMGLRYDRAVSSPYVRALETASIVGEVFGVERVLELDELIPAADPRETAAKLFEHGRASGATIAAFGHNPSITSAVSWMLGGGGNAALLNIAPGDAVHLRVLSSPLGPDGPEAILTGFYPRKRLAALASGPSSVRGDV
jgi:phosphohistidine phosphatase